MVELRETDAVWTQDRARVILAQEGVFWLPDDIEFGEVVGPDGDRWFEVLVDGTLSGYAWITFGRDGRAEIMVALTAESQGHGVGSEVLSHLEAVLRDMGEQASVGLIQSTNPQAARVASWLAKNGYSLTVNGKFLPLKGNVEKFIRTNNDLVFVKILLSESGSSD